MKATIRQIARAAAVDIRELVQQAGHIPRPEVFEAATALRIEEALHQAVLEHTLESFAQPLPADAHE